MPDQYLTASGTSDDVAINAAYINAGDGFTVYLANGNYDITGEINVQAGVNIQGASMSETVLVSNGVSQEQMMYNNGNISGGDNCDIKNITFDCNADAGTQSFQMRNVSGCVLENITIKDSAIHHATIAGCRSSTFNNITTIQDSVVVQTISHGIDIDFDGVETRLTTNCTFNNCNLSNSYMGECIKIELSDNIVLNNCTFNGLVAIGSSATYANTKNIEFNGCIINSILTVLSTGVNTNSISECTFTQNGGAIIVNNDGDGTLNIDVGTIFNGRNKYVGYNGTTWDDALLSVINDAGAVHNDVSTIGAEKTIFASYNDTGSIFWSNGGRAPYITPNTGRNSYIDLVKDVNLVVDNVSCALLSDYGTTVWPGGTSSISPNSAGPNVIFKAEGYPGKAIIDATSITTHLFNITVNTITGSSIHDFDVRNIPAGMAVFRGEVNISIATIYSVHDVNMSNSLNKTIELNNIRQGATLKFFNCTISDISGSKDGLVCKTNQAGDSIVMEGCRLIDISPQNGALRGTSGSNLYLTGCELVRCDGLIGGVLLQGRGDISNCTFINNTGSPADIHNSSNDLTTTNCIFEADDTVTGTFTSVTDLTALPDFINTSDDDYNLLAEDGEGTKFWSGNPRPSGYNKEPYPDTKIDRGANQSVYDVNHPANLPYSSTYTLDSGSTVKEVDDLNPSDSTHDLIYNNVTPEDWGDYTYNATSADCSGGPGWEHDGEGTTVCIA